MGLLNIKDRVTIDDLGTTREYPTISVESSSVGEKLASAVRPFFR